MKTTNPNEVILSCRVSKEMKRELKRLAKEDRRTMASFTAMLLESALQARNPQVAA